MNLSDRVGRFNTSPAHGHVQRGRLAEARHRRHHRNVEDDEATRLMLEALFHIKVAVDEIHRVVVDEDDEDEAEEDT